MGERGEKDHLVDRAGLPGQKAQQVRQTGVGQPLCGANTQGDQAVRHRVLLSRLVGRIALAQ